MFNGTGVAMVTPFKNGQIDWDAQERVINHIIGGGVDFLVVLGTTGESATLSPKERFQVFDFCVEKVAGRVPVVVGMGGNNTAEIVEQVKEYHFNGVDGILSVSPYYNKPTQEGIFQHFMAIANASPRPIILYNVPSRTASNMSAETTLRLANASDKFVAVKEASGDLRQVMEIVHRKPEGFLVLSGDDNITLPMASFGIDGLISVVGNAYPQETSDMVRAAMRGDFETARRLHFQLMPIVDLLFIDGNPAGVKAVLEMMDVCKREVRLPLVPVREETYAKLERLVLNKVRSENAEQR